LKSKDGYKPKEKKRELFHPHSRFLLASRAGQDDESDAPIAGFLMWRFDFEECFSAEEGQVEVVYWCVEFPSQALYAASLILTFF
jgi:hypothetical protein